MDLHLESLGVCKETIYSVVLGAGETCDFEICICNMVLKLDNSLPNLFRRAVWCFAGEAGRGRTH